MYRIIRKEVTNIIDGWKQKVITPNKVELNVAEPNIAELNVILLNRNRELLKQAGYDTFEEG
jgi:hypothetical protein